LLSRSEESEQEEGDSETTRHDSQTRDQRHTICPDQLDRQQANDPALTSPQFAYCLNEGPCARENVAR